MAKAAKNKPGFKFGDHQFLHPTVNGPLDRMFAPKKQILGAPPPTYLDGIAQEATKKSPAAKELFRSPFCGHDEPTMTIFDIVIDGETDLEISALLDPKDPENAGNVPLLAARPAGGDGKWRVLFRRKWEERQATLEGIAKSPVSKKEAAELEGENTLGQVSIGFEYPCDAQSRDEVTWLTIEILQKGKKKPIRIVDAELA